MVLQKIHPFYKFIHAVVKQFWEEDCMTRASSLAYTTLLSLVPLIAASLLLFKLFPNFHDLSERVQDFIFENFVAASAQVVQHHLQHFVEQAMKLSATGLISLIITAVLMIFNMEQAFNAIWHLKKRRRGLPAFIMYWAVLTALPLLIGIGLAISSYVTATTIWSGAKALKIFHKLIGFTPVILSCLAFTLLYLTVPNCKVPLRAALVGGLVAGILFEAAKYSFTLYITHFPTYALLYGALAIIPIFLVWVYLSWLITLLGVIVSRVWAHQVEHKRIIGMR